MFPLCNGVCVDCSFNVVCGFAGGSDSGYTCPSNFHCRVDGDTLEYINSCFFSRSKFHYFDLSRSEVDFLLNWVMNVEDCGVKYVDLPRLVPIVSLENKNFIELLNELDVRAVIVSFTDLLRPKILMRLLSLVFMAF